jgi:hypothetical protein
MLTAATLFFADQPGEEPRPQPRDTTQAAEQLALHPTDWQAATVLSEHALDEDGRYRLREWRAASELAIQLAPHFDAARSGFVRAGLFHWYELGDSDRRAVLGEMAPLLRDPAVFFRMAQPLFELTGDLKYLRRYGPHTIDAIDTLRVMAVTNGRFKDYRELRKELVTMRTAELLRQLTSLEPSQIVSSLPAHPTVDEEPLLRSVLLALHTRPLEVDCGRPDILEALIDFAVRHGLTPLDGLRPVTREPSWANAFARAQLARALGDDASATANGLGGERPPRGEVIVINGVRWDGACGPSICRIAVADVSGPLSITLDNAISDEVPPYVECFVDDVRVWEGPVGQKTTIPLVAAGQHRVEVMLANPLTRNRSPRAVRLS